MAGVRRHIQLKRDRRCGVKHGDPVSVFIFFSRLLNIAAAEKPHVSIALLSIIHVKSGSDMALKVVQCMSEEKSNCIWQKAFRFWENKSDNAKRRFSPKGENRLFERAR